MVLNAKNLGRRSSTHLQTVNSINIGSDILNILCRYVLQDSRLIRMEHLVHLRRLLFSIDPSMYENDPDKAKKFKYLFKVLEARLDFNLNDVEMILAHVNGGIEFKIDFLDYNKLVMSKSDVEWCHITVEETLKFAFFYNDSRELQDLLTQFNAADMTRKPQIAKMAEPLIDKIKNEFRKVHVESNLNDVTFSLEDGTFESAVTDTYNMVTNPSRRLYTGMQGFNQMIGGGFESGRVYMFLGVAGVGKSLTLLNLINQIKRYNVRAKAKDPSKTPCIVMLTMENTVVETITRMFDMVVNDSKGMANYDRDEVIYKMRTEGGLQITESSPLDIVIRYKPNRSISTDYLYTLYDDLLDQGKEMVCLIQDHVKRIRSIDGQQDLRLELGDIVNELKVFAADKDIPVITVSHLNREASRIIEDAARKGSVDAGKLLGKSNIGESLLMVDNLDCGITLARDFDKDGNMYMTFHRIKMRDKGSTREYIAQPFLIDNPIRLVEDVGGVPQFKETLHIAPVLNTANVRMTGSNSIAPETLNNVIDVDDINDNVFTNKAAINLGPISAKDSNDIFKVQAESFDEDMSELIKEISERHANRVVLPMPSENPPRKAFVPIQKRQAVYFY